MTPDELERLLLCRHNCKIDCLLKQYDKLKALVKARIDRMISVLPAADPHEIEFLLTGLKAEMEDGE